MKLGLFHHSLFIQIFFNYIVDMNVLWTRVFGGKLCLEITVT